jgi:hypothetical protein
MMAARTRLIFVQKKVLRRRNGEIEDLDQSFPLFFRESAKGKGNVRFADESPCGKKSLRLIRKIAHVLSVLEEPVQLPPLQLGCQRLHVTEE